MTKNNKLNMDKNVYVAYLIGIVSIIINSIFGVSKIVLGVVLAKFGYGNSTLIADGIHSFTDVVTSIVAVISIKIISRPRDDKYNYGYERYSSIASVIVASIFFTIGMTLLVESIYGLIETGFEIQPKASVDTIFIVSMVVLGLSILMKVIMFFLIYFSGKKIKNDAMKLESYHQFVDSLSSFASIASLLFSLFGIYYVDYFHSIGIVVMIFVVSIETLKRGIYELSDHSINKQTLEQIKTYLKTKFPDVQFTMMKTRSYSDKYYMDLELDIDCEMNVHNATYLASKVKKELLDNFDMMKDVNITFKPICTDDTYNCSHQEEHDVNMLINKEETGNKTKNQ